MKQSLVKSLISKALLELLIKKPYYEITVKEIVTTAGVCRASFYRNYFTMDDVVDQLIEELFSDFYDQEIMTPDNMRIMVLRFFQGVKSHRKELKILLKRGLGTRVSTKLHQQTLEQIGQLNVFNNRYQPYFFSGASAAMLFAWIENDFEEPAETMVQIFFDSLHGYMDLSDFALPVH